MPILPDGSWIPLMTQRQIELFNLCRSRQKTFVLASGPRLSGKTLACLHALCDHAWNTPNANICIVTVTQSAGMDSGIWTDLTEMILPQWIEEGNFGMRWIRRPSVSGVTKKPYCIVNNRYGHNVKIQLESLKNETEAEARFKGKRYSMLLVNELSNFRNPASFRTWAECLRIVGLKPQMHLFLADTNPSDEGTNSWIYKIWYDLPAVDFSRQQHDQESEELKAYRYLQPLVGKVEFTLEDNILIEPERIQRLKAAYAGDPDQYARYVLGKWVTATTDSLFYSVFKESIHVVPPIPTGAGDDREIMVPEPECSELITGWDPGVSNCATVIVEKVIANLNGEPTSYFKVLDELVVIGQTVDISGFVYQVAQKLKYWQSVIGKSISCKHYSDRYAFDVKEPMGNRYLHQIIFDESPIDTPGGPITLIAAERGKGSVAQKVELLRQLLFQRRIFFSRYKAPICIQMLKSIKRGRTALSVIDTASQYKHVFDALMYAIASECYDEIARMVATKRFKEDSYVPVLI
jgi:hypothetical protein